MTKQVIVLVGLPGSGKSSWAKEQLDQYPGRYKRIGKDDLRAMLDGGKHSQGNEKFILKVRDALILQALGEGYHVLVDDTNFHSKHLTQIRELVKGKAVVSIQDFTQVPLEECIERDRKRPNSVGEREIRKMHRMYLWKPTPAPVYDPELLDALIFDLDGTLALLNGRNPYDASTCEHDLLNEPVARALWNFTKLTGSAIIVSGRKERDRVMTEDWLDRYLLRHVALYMRADDDDREDSVVKREIYERSLRGNYNIVGVYDDRDRLVRMWRSLGLPCFQVADGDF